MTDHQEYLRCWQVYLKKIGKDRRFTTAVNREVHWANVVDWPKVWPEVCYLFHPGQEYDAASGVENFVRIVRLAEREAT